MFICTYVYVSIYSKLATNDWEKLRPINCFTDVLVISFYLSIITSLLPTWTTKFVCFFFCQQPLAYSFFFSYINTDSVLLFIVFEIGIGAILCGLYQDNKIDKVNFYSHYQKQQKLEDWNIILNSLLPIPVAIVKKSDGKPLFANQRFIEENELDE